MLLLRTSNKVIVGIIWDGLFVSYDFNEPGSLGDYSIRFFRLHFMDDILEQLDRLRVLGILVEQPQSKHSDLR